MIEPPSLRTPGIAPGEPSTPSSPNARDSAAAASPTAATGETTAGSAPPVSPVAGWGPRFARWAAVPVADHLRNFAIAGAVVGALIGLSRAAALHVPAGGMAIAALRLAVAGAAAGASLPAALRALATLARAAGWIVLAIALGWLALVIAGRLEWIRALAPTGVPR